MSNKLFAVIIILIIAAFNITFFLNHHHSVTNKSTSLSSLNTGPYPWQSTNSKLSATLTSLHLKPVSITPNQNHLDITINNKHLSIPANIGNANGIKAPINSSSNNLINVGNNQSYTLGQFFDIWGVKFTNTQIGAYANNSHDTISVFDNCKRIPNPVTLNLSSHQEIAIWYGPTNQKPNIACSYHF